MGRVSQSGWTLLELLMAVAVLGVLAAIAIPQQGRYVDRVKVQQAVQDIGVISLTLSDILLDQGRLPDSLDEIGMGGMVDPWGNPYHYTNVQSAQGKGGLRKDRNLVPINTDYDLYSAGPDGKSVSPLTAKASQDDIIRAGNGAFIGLAADY